MTQPEIQIFKWCHSNGKPLTEHWVAISVPITLATVAVAMTIYFGRDLLVGVMNGESKVVTSNAIFIFSSWYLFYIQNRLSPAKKAIVRSLESSAETFSVGMILHNMITNEKTELTRTFHWKDVVDIRQRDLIADENYSVGFYWTEIELKNANDIGNVLYLKHSENDSDSACSKSQECLKNLLLIYQQSNKLN